MRWSQNFLREVAASAVGTYLVLLVGFVFAKFTGAFSGVNWGQVAITAIPLVAAILASALNGVHLVRESAEIRKVWREWREGRRRR
jgi:uncharacterized YccA/Bax inhibitor family protein